MGFLVRTFSWPIIVGASWIKNQRLNSSKIFHLVLDDESIELFDHSKSAAGFKTLKYLISEPKIQVMSLEIDTLPSSFTAQEELRNILLRWKERYGRTIFVYLRNPSLQGYWLASVGDFIHIAPCQDTFFIPIASRTTFYGQLLQSIGIQADIVAAGECKSLGEPYTRSFPSQPNREQLTQIFKQLQLHMAQDIWESRKEKFQSKNILSFELFKNMMESGLLTSSEMKKSGIVDTISYIDQYEKAISEFTKSKYRTLNMSISPLLNVVNWNREMDISTRVAQVNLSGAIVEQSSGGRRIESKSCLSILKNIRKDNSIKGVLLVIDSPGGSAIASDRIARAIDKLVEKKPVVAFMRSVAASGGYYIACRCLHITAQPTTITGSIGVVGGKVAFGRALENIGVTSELIAGGNKESASLFSTWTPFTKNQRSQMKALLENTYERFLQVVSGGRKMPLNQVRKLAEGRVYTGLEAHKIGLVDEIGGIETAKAQLAKRIGVRRIKTIEYSMKKKTTIIKRIRQFTSVGMHSSQPEQITQIFDSMIPEEMQLIHQYPYQPLMLMPFHIDQ